MPFDLDRILHIDPRDAAERIAGTIQRKHVELRRRGIVIGLSGGIDSAVAASLSVRAVGAPNVRALILPERDSAPGSLRDAELVGRHLSIRVETFDITGVLNGFDLYRNSALRVLPRKVAAWMFRKGVRYYASRPGRSVFEKSLGVTDAGRAPFVKWGNAYHRLKHRIRMAALYSVADRTNSLVVGAANKTEWSIGFFVKFGCDHAADCMPLLGLYKTQVFRLAEYLQIPERIIRKPPSPDLFPGLYDEEATGISYEKMDKILAGLENDGDCREIARAAGVEPETVDRVRSLIEASRHMRESL